MKKLWLGECDEQYSKIKTLV